MKRPSMGRNEILLGEEDFWTRYCGFFDLSVSEFMEIQHHLLREQIQLIAGTPVGRRFINGRVPGSVTEFRATVSPTTYEDYRPLFNGKREETSGYKPFCWAHTSGRSGTPKWVPYPRRGYDVLADHVAATLILASANRKGEIRFKSGDLGLYNTPPRPYFSGVAACAGAERLDIRFIPPLEISEKMEFEERIEEGFKMALYSGVDFIGSMTAVLIKVGEAFATRSARIKFSTSLLRPPVLFRLLRAYVRSRLQKRGMLPKDLWHLKAIIASGTDTAIYRDRIEYFWGRQPYEVYACTEGGILALQSWSKKAMTFSPYSAFLEFVPEDEWLKTREDPGYCPNTVLLDEVKPGRYELLLTSFYGMPFLRYRVGDLVKFVSLSDDEAGIKLPQMMFDSRADDLIDLAGFARLDERMVFQSLVNSNLDFEDWTMRKELNGTHPALHLYIELKSDQDSRVVEQRVDESLSALDTGYADIRRLLGLHPLRVTVLPAGSFRRYYQEKRAAGFDLAHLKPPHMNPPDDSIERLLSIA